MRQQLKLVLRIEQGLTNPVKSIAKGALGRSLMLFDANGFDVMSPRSHMIGPTKGNREDGKQGLESIFFF